MAKYFAQQLDVQTGTLVNISSCHALAAIPGQSGYCCSKIAAARMMEILHLGQDESD
jgi:short-subunit dehydrogenase